MEEQILLNELMYEVVLPSKRERTLFDISGTASREVVISNWYKYFLTPDEDHGLGLLFIDSLVELLGNPFTLHTFKVQTEVPTKNGRIDVLLTGNQNDNGKYVVIENKIFHWLHNDLQDYWEYLPDSAVAKTGVLLTLRKQSIPIDVSKHFSNILHINWINHVAEKVSQLTLSQEQNFYFKNFHSMFKNLNRYDTIDDSTKFYFKNVDSINSLISCKDEARNYISVQLQKACDQLEMNITQTDSPRHRTFIPRGFKDVLAYEVIFEKLFSTEHELRITLGLGNKSRHRVSEIDTVFADEIKKSTLQLNASKGTGWHNYLTKIYKIDESKLSDLANFVTKTINDNFSFYTERIGKFLVTGSLSGV